jgi:hypothetical protein
VSRVRGPPVSGPFRESAEFPTEVKEVLAMFAWGTSVSAALCGVLYTFKELHDHLVNFLRLHALQIRLRRR